MPPASTTIARCPENAGQERSSSGATSLTQECPTGLTAAGDPGRLRLQRSHEPLSERR
jgi:hypothetical protein